MVFLGLLRNLTNDRHRNAESALELIPKRAIPCTLAGLACDRNIRITSSYVIAQNLHVSPQSKTQIKPLRLCASAVNVHHSSLRIPPPASLKLTSSTSTSTANIKS